VKPLPLIVTFVPVVAAGGVTPPTYGRTVKLDELVPVAVPTMTEIGPLVAPFGTAAVICVVVSTVKLVALVPLNFTAVAPSNGPPVIVIESPGTPLVGRKPEIDGTIEKLVSLTNVPSGEVTLIGPLVADGGTVTVSVCALAFVDHVEAAFPLKLTAVAFSKRFPWITTWEPNPAADGA
jgi:hypothetical protein